MPSRPLIIVDITAPNLDGILKEFGSEGRADPREFTRYDGNEFDFLFVEKTGDPLIPFRRADLTGYTIQSAIGELDDPPTAGTFDLSYNSSSTGLTGLAYNVSAATLETALNGNTTLTTISTVTVNTGTDVLTTGGAHSLSVGDRVRFTNSGGGLPSPLVAGTDYYVLSVPTTTTLTISATSGGSIIDLTTAGTGTHTIHGTVDVDQFESSYQITYRFCGTKFLLGSTATALVPESYASVTQVVAGAAGVQEIQWLRLVQKPLAYTSSFVAGSSGSADVEVLQAGTSSLAEVQRISLDLPSYSGSIIVNLTTRQEFRITCVADVAASLHQDGLIFEDANGSVGFWMDVSGGGTAPAEILACDRTYEITTVTSGMSAANVATQWATALDADSEFTASASGNVVTVRQASGGSRIDPTDVGTGFGLEVTQDGTTATAAVPVDASATAMSAGLDGVVSVAKSGTYQWDVVFQSPGAQDTITVSAEALFQTVYTASLSLSNQQTFRRFASEDPDTDTIEVPWEISITPSGGLPITVYRQIHEVSRDVITPDVSASTLLPNGLTAVYTTNTVWVDAEYGSDSGANIGLRERLDRPFLTPEAAESAAVSGDRIVVRKANYTLSSSLGAKSLFWDFESGAGLASAGAVFAVSTGVTVRIRGGIGATLFSDIGAFTVSHASAIVTIEDITIQATTGIGLSITAGATVNIDRCTISGPGQGINMSAGTVTVRRSRIVGSDTGGDGITKSGGTLKLRDNEIVANATGDSVNGSGTVLAWNNVWNRATATVTISGAGNTQDSNLT